MPPDLGEERGRPEEARRPRDLGRPAAGPGPELGPDLAQVAEPVVELRDRFRRTPFVAVEPRVSVSPNIRGVARRAGPRLRGFPYF